MFWNKKIDNSFVIKKDGTKIQLNKTDHTRIDQDGNIFVNGTKIKDAIEIIIDRRKK